jgi:hypothetical protein
MGVYKLSTAGGLTTPRTNYSSFLAGNPKFVSPAYESIATTTVGSGGSANIEFTSITSTYKHLQIRGIARTNRALTRDALKITVNGNTSTYGYRILYGDGATAVAAGLGSEPDIAFTDIAGGNAAASVFGVMIIDILDYVSTTKIKTLRSLGGSDDNGSGRVAISSGAYFGNTNALTSIKLEPYGGTTFQQYTQFALYGIKA